MANIMYIHGLGSSANGGNTIKYLRDNYNNVYSFDVPINPIEAVSYLQKKVYENEIDLVISTSLGSFYSMMLKDVKRIIVNPCLFPSVEIPKISPIGVMNKYYYPREDGNDFYTITNEIVEQYKSLEEKLNDILSSDDFKLNSSFIFGLNDEHFSYINYVNKYMNNNIYTCNSPHRLSLDDQNNILKPLIDKNIKK